MCHCVFAFTHPIRGLGHSYRYAQMSVVCLVFVPTLFFVGSGSKSQNKIGSTCCFN